MKFLIRKRSLKMLLFLLTGLILATLSGYQLYDFLLTNEFVYEFPGDWDKPLGISVGLFLIIRSLKFINESRELFIKISKNSISFRVLETEKVRKIALSDIKKIEEKKNSIVLETLNHNKITVIDFKNIRMRDDKSKTIKKTLLELNG